MTTTSHHHKHPELVRPEQGNFHRNELGILGTNCGQINSLVTALMAELSPLYKVGYVDADHRSSAADDDQLLINGCSGYLMDHISHRSFDTRQVIEPFSSRAMLVHQDLVLVNGNHFAANAQIVVIDPAKSLEAKLDKLTNVRLILLTERAEGIPQYLSDHLPVGHSVSVPKISDVLSIASFIQKYLEERLTPIKGLVLAGGKSTRMKEDKGSIEYFGKSQRVHVYEMLNKHCAGTYVSYDDIASIDDNESIPVITDSFLGLGPLGGILSAMRTDPNSAWLTVACDLPFLSAETLEYLVAHRDTSKVATCFMDSNGKFPEPLITIWEPRAYAVLLQFLAQGYACPRKALINTDVAILQAPDVSEFANINNPEERQMAMQRLHPDS
ncbi:NTP transferase domain-containing protein [Mucilaginibacter daejeonensis]|uniref:NTP transferase domain-containing protein n=1 Tax=Mucilaginibacter daejeonensis TaxID=398049 RepID=UPI001D172614|nr:NTP transferase domain-containing protein [Mucilaginibacter daejeonensis]UEG53582.1 NTP transferase domain-containing protein [Mucilaginibacter daejeonensis]